MIDFQRLDRERASHNGPRQVEVKGIELQEGCDRVLGREHQAIQIEPQGEQVVVEPIKLSVQPYPFEARYGESGDAGSGPRRVENARNNDKHGNDGAGDRAPPVCSPFMNQIDDHSVLFGTSC